MRPCLGVRRVHALIRRRCSMPRPGTSCGTRWRYAGYSSGKVREEQPLLRVDLDQEHDQAGHDGQDRLAEPGKERGAEDHPQQTRVDRMTRHRIRPAGSGAGDRHRPRVRCSTTSPARSGPTAQRQSRRSARQGRGTAPTPRRRPGSARGRDRTNRTMEHARNVAAANVTGLDSARIRSLGACDALYSAPASHTIRTVPQQATTRHDHDLVVHIRDRYSAPSRLPCAVLTSAACRTPR